MKKLFASISVLGLVLSARLHSAPSGTAVAVPWTVSWTDTNIQPFLTFYAPKTNSCYFVVSTNVIGAALNTWPIVATVTNWTFTTNGGKIYYNTTVLVPPSGNQFFSVFSSNVWGQTTVPLAVDQTGPVSSPPPEAILSR